MAVFLYLLNARGAGAFKLLPDLLIGVAAFGVAAGLVGTFIGAAVLCASIDDKQCGFGGSLVGGPLGLALGVGGFLYWWMRRVTAP